MCSCNSNRSIRRMTSLKTRARRQEFRKKAIGRYILRRIHDAGKSGVEAARDTTKLTVEHVLPINRGDAWQGQFRGEDTTDYVYRLGNLTLLEAGRNRGLGNRDFFAKKDVYRASEIDMTREIADMATWSADAIEERSARLAEKMADTGALIPEESAPLFGSMR